MKPTDKHEDPEQGNFIVILPEDALLPEEGRRSEDGDVHEADPQVREHPGATPGSTGRRFFTDWRWGWPLSGSLPGAGATTGFR